MSVRYCGRDVTEEDLELIRSLAVELPTRTAIAEAACLGLMGLIELVRVDTKAASIRWRRLIATHHYLGYTPFAGAQLRYLVESRHGALGFAASAWTCAPRDGHIGWGTATRKEQRRLVVGNARFLILLNVTVPNLASHILGSVSRRLAADWQRVYGYQPVLLVTFVETGRFTGASYRAANWLHVGQTKRRGKLDRYTEHALPVKGVYLYLYERYQSCRSRSLELAPPRSGSGSGARSDA